MRKHLLKSLLALALVLISGNVWGETKTITLDALCGVKSSYGDTEQTFELSGAKFGYIATMYNGKGSPTGYAAKQVLQMRKATNTKPGGQLYNTTAINGLQSVKVYLVSNDNDFTLYYGTSAKAETNSIAKSSLTSTTETVSIEQSTGGSSDVDATVYTFDLSSSNPSYFYIANGTKANYIYKVVISYVGENDDDDDDDDGGDTPGALTTIDQIQAACTTAGATATDATITFNNWVVTGIKGGNNIYVSDGAKGFVIYGKTTGFATGDVLSGTVACKVQFYSNNTYELTELTSTTTGLTVTKGGTVTPKVMTLADVTLANQGTVVTLKNVDYDGKFFTDGTNKVQFYDAFSTSVSLNAGGKYNVTGIVIPYSTIEIAPRTADDVEALSSQEAAESSWAKTSVAVKLGETVSNTFSTTSDGAVTYTSSKTSVATVAADGTITVVGAGSTTITAETAETDNFFASAASFTLTVNDPDAAEQTDVIVFDWRTDEEGYGPWPTTEGESGAEYAINSFLGNTSGLIQLRSDPNKSDNTYSGLVVSSSVGFVTKVVINWGGQTAAERTVDVYGKNTAYSSANDLWSNATKGTKLGSVVKGTSTELEINGNYPFIGLRSKSSALYISSIEITWSKAYSRGVTEGEFGTICLPFDISFGDASGAKFYTVAGKTVSAGAPQAIVLDEVDKLAAGVPYIFQATDSKLTCKFTGSAVEEAGHVGGLYGTFADATAVESGKYVIYNNTVKMCGSDCTVDAFRAYIDMDEVEEATGAGAVSIRVGDATGISLLTEESDGEFYDLQGRRMAQPQRGIFLVKGQKVIVK